MYLGGWGKSLVFCHVLRGMGEVTGGGVCNVPRAPGEVTSGGICHGSKGAWGSHWWEHLSWYPGGRRKSLVHWLLESFTFHDEVVNCINNCKIFNKAKTSGLHTIFVSD